MLRNIVQFGGIAERLIGLVYARLAACPFVTDTARETLHRLAREERAHAEVMDRLRTAVPESYESYDYDQLFDGQGRFMAACVQLLEMEIAGRADYQVVVERAIILEKELSDNLFIHFKLLVPEESRTEIQSLAAASATHGEVLESLLSGG